MLCSKVLGRFADHLCLLHFLMSSCWTKATVMASFLRRLACICTTNDTSYYVTDYITTGHSRLSVKLLGFLSCSKTADQARAWS